MTFTPDRRHIKVIQPYTGAADHTRGLATTFRSAALWSMNLFSQLDTAYAAGFRRFWIYAPAGLPTGQTALGLDHWRYLPDDVKALLTWGIPDWLNTQSDAVISPYLGFSMSPNNRFHYDDADLRVPFQDPVDTRVQFADAIEPWLALSPLPGQVGLCLANSTSSRFVRQFEQWVDEYQARGVWIAGGPIVFSAATDQLGINGRLVSAPIPLIEKAPLFALRDEVNLLVPSAVTFDTSTTEVIVGFEDGDLGDVSDAQAWVDRGFVLASWHDNNDAHILATV